MSSAWPTVELGWVLKHRKEFIEIDDLTTYARPRVRLHAQGVVLRDRVLGAEIKTKKQQVCRPGEFLVAEIDAKVGGFGIVPDDLGGALVSSHYFLFQIDESKLDRRFLDFYSRTREFREQVEAQGSTNYAAIRPADVLAYQVPLPPMQEQRRIVDRIEATAGKIEEARRLRDEADSEIATLRVRALSALFPVPRGSVLCDFAGFQTGYAFKSDWFAEEGIPLVRNANVSHGRLDWTAKVCVPSEMAFEFERFALEAGDVLVSLDRPIISTGIKVAQVVQSDLPALLLQRVARAIVDEACLTRSYLFRWMQSSHFADSLDPGRSNGVPHISHKDIEKIPFACPSLVEQATVVSAFDELANQFAAIEAAHRESASQLDALPSACLDRAFGGGL